MKNLKSKLVLAALCVAAMPLSASADTQSVTASITFDTPLSLNKTSDIDFGVVKAGANDTYVIDATTGTVTATTPSDIFPASATSTPNAANIDITGSTSQLIDISAGNYVASGGLTLSAATCKYGGATEAACALTSQPAPGASTSLLVGATLAADGTQTASSTPMTATFDITVVYH